MHIFLGKTAIFVQIPCLKMNCFSIVPSGRRIFRMLSAAAAALFLLNSCGGDGRYVSIAGYAQGGTYTVKLNMSGSVRTAEELKAGIDSVLVRIDSSLSGYNASSLLSRFNAGEAIVPDDIFIDIYGKSYGYYDETGGCVDVSAGALFDLWGFGFTSDSLPSDAEVKKVLEDTGMGRLKRDMKSALDSEGRLTAAALLSDGVSGPPPVLNYNAVAQGYSCDLVAAYLEKQGVTDMLVDIGGEIYCRGYNPSGKPWVVGIDRPVDGNNVPGADLQGVFQAGPGPVGIVTSGNYRKFYVKDGKKYAHTIDPRTGYPVSHSLLCATVVGGNAAETDALATYCMVIGLDEAIRFISSREDIEACLVYDVDGTLKTWTSDGFELLTDR